MTTIKTVGKTMFQAMFKAIAIVTMTVGMLFAIPLNIVKCMVLKAIGKDSMGIKFTLDMFLTSYRIIVCQLLGLVKTEELGN